MLDHNAPLTLLAHEGAAQMHADDNTRTASLDGAAGDLPTWKSPPLAMVEPADVYASAGVKLELRGDVASLETEWTAFERSAECTVFQTFGWLAKWQQHIGSLGGTRPAIVLGRSEQGALLFILPLAVEARGPIRRLTWLGSELCDYNAPLIARDFWAHMGDVGDFTELWGKVLNLLRSDPRLRFDLVDLQKMAETVGTERNPFLALATLPNASGAHVATLGRNWDDFYKTKRSSETRKKERKQLKRLAEMGEVRFVEAKDAVEIDRTIETLMQQKAKTFARMGVGNLFA